jgi:hypothetical protein
VRPYLEKHTRAGGVAQGVDPEFKPQYCPPPPKKKEKRKKKKKVIQIT